ncbi:MAG: hypothetical protein ACRCT2_10805, partial [Plesiomonas shigelloides]
YGRGLVRLLGRSRRGRSLYDPEFAVAGYQMALLGAPMANLAELIGVSEQTLYNWQHDHPEFGLAIQVGRQAANANVAARLYQRAMGYSYESEEIKVVEGEIVRVPVVKHVPPCPNSMKFFLINREPELWKERVEVVEKPTIALVDKDAMDQLFNGVLQKSDDIRSSLQSRGHRLGLLLDSEKGGAQRDDEEVVTFGPNAEGDD